MALGIGGAETHIVDLVCALAAQGHDITVASRGGIYTSALAEKGIRHITVPLHTRSVFSMIRSYNILYRLIKAERFDVVHAHARIPAFICGMLAKRLKFRYVTTAHGVYKATPALIKFSNWGQRQLAVSCDIKKYLIDNYGINSDSVSLTINGIDPEKFAPRDTRYEVCAELGLSPGCRHRIIYVSRIDRESSHPGFHLLYSVSELCAEYPDIEVLAVGAGTDYERFCAEADKINERLKRKAVFAPGARTDIARLLCAADIFVGVSRAAMEAMACGLPVILAGSQGYIGFFDESVKKVSLATNFCCRGCVSSSPQLVGEALSSAFKKSESELKKSGEYNRGVILTHFSVEKMAGDALELYKSVPDPASLRRGDIIISGYYGFGNTGDDSLLAMITKNLRTSIPEATITVLSHRPAATAKVFGVRAINRINVFAIAREMRRAKMLVCGSGNLIQNVTSTRSLLYYLFIMRMAYKRGLSVMMYASGIGPLTGRFARNTAAKMLNRLDVITLREESSADELARLGVTKPQILPTADPALLTAAACEEWMEYLAVGLGIESGKKYFAVALREWKNTPESFEKNIAAAITKICASHNAIPVFVPMQQSKDEKICRRIQGVTGGIVAAGLCASELVGLCAKMEFVIGMRLHILIYAAAAATPFAGLAYDTKIDALTGHFGLSEYNTHIDGFDKEWLAGCADRLILRRAELSRRIGEKTAVLSEAAKIDTAAAAQLFKHTKKQRNRRF